MEAIILAAGRGDRLAALNPDGRPKCLLEFGGRSLLDRQLEALQDCGVRRVELVIGYEADRVIEHVGTLQRRPEVAFAYNPMYTAGSVLSLLAARDVLSQGRATLVLDADVLFHPDVLRRLLDSAHANCFLLDRNFEDSPEPVRIAVRDGRMIDFRKGLASDLDCDFQGESVGFFKLDGVLSRELAGTCLSYERDGLDDAPHEEALRDLLLADPERFGFEEVTGLPWIEIDFPEDIERAIKETLPPIEAATEQGA